MEGTQDNSRLRSGAVTGKLTDEGQAPLGWVLVTLLPQNLCESSKPPLHLTPQPHPPAPALPSQSQDCPAQSGDKGSALPPQNL